MKYVGTCPFCKAETAIEVTEESMLAYKNGAPAQQAFDYLTPMEREVIIIGMCYSCSEKMYNVPAPGNEDKFGERLGYCTNCGCAAWEKDLLEEHFVCPSCGGDEYEED